MTADLPSLQRLLRLRGPLGLVEIATALGCSTKTKTGIKTGDGTGIASTAPKRAHA